MKRWEKPNAVLQHGLEHRALSLEGYRDIKAQLQPFPSMKGRSGWSVPVRKTTDQLSTSSCINKLKHRIAVSPERPKS